MNFSTVAHFSKRTTVTVALVSGFLAVGCNAILGNDDATLDKGRSANNGDASVNVVNPTTIGSDTSPDGAVANGNSGSGDDDASADSSSTGNVGDPDGSTGAISPTCGANENMCSGTCVQTSNPLFGCGASSCAPCAISRGTAACNAGKCILAACDPGYADCNQDPSDGCETDLSDPSHCGACNATCAAAAPNCAPVGASFECTTGCSGSAPTLCGKQCVDLTSTANHCGACNNACPAVGNGKASCSNSTCAFTCNNGFHACGSTCVSSSAAATCGTSCTPCTVPANATASCTSGACGFTCNAGFGDCDKDASNGCEATLVGGACPMPVVDAGMMDSAAPSDASND